MPRKVGSLDFALCAQQPHLFESSNLTPELVREERVGTMDP